MVFGINKEPDPMQQYKSYSDADYYNLARNQAAGLSPEYSEQLQERPEEKFLEQLNPEALINELSNELRGKYYDTQTKKWLQIPGIDLNKQMTEEGVAEIIKRVRARVNTSTVYSNLEDDIIRKIVISLADEVSTFLSLHYKEYNIKVIDIREITHKVADVVYIALKRGDEALTLRMLRTMIQSRELTTNQQSQKQGFNLLKPGTWLGGGR